MLDSYAWVPEGFSLMDLAKIPIEDQWSKEMVEERLIEAVRLAERIVIRPTPHSVGSGWPRHIYEWSDYLAQVESPEDAKKYNRFKISASRKEIQQMEESIQWQTLYLNGYLGAARVLSAFLRARARRKSFTEEIKKRGWSKSTAYRLRDRALTLIALGLMRDKVMP